ncbi:MAG: aspartate aminotransferase family protein [Thermoflexales bacterium]|nr:aspartate aminotransferase family protein [Thermoflexales bacterium]
MTKPRKHIHLKTELPGPNSRALVARREAAMPLGFAKSTPLGVRRAHGALVEDVDGNTLIDFTGGIGVLNVGHTPTEVVEAIRAQAGDLIHISGLVATTEAHVRLAEKLCEIAPIPGPKKAMINNSGAEAVEAAIATARAATGRQAIIAFEGAYHGRTLLGQSLTSKYALFKKNFGPFAPEIYRVPYPYLYRMVAADGMSDAQKVELVWESFERALIAHVAPEAVAAVIVEPVQGEGGFIPMPVEFMRRLRAACDRYGIVLIADEVQSGFARTGRMFAMEHFGVSPDIITLAKSMGGGMPIAATVGRAELMDKPHPGGLGGTYSGNPVACAAALAAIDLLEKDDLPARARHVGGIACDRLRDMQGRIPILGDVRGLGAMLAIELVEDKASKKPLAVERTLSVVNYAARNGVLMIRCGLYSNGVRFLFPLVISDSELQEGLDVVEEGLLQA